MKKKHYSIAQLSSETARRAQTEAAIAQRKLKKERGDLTNLRLSAASPKIKSKRTWTKKTMEESFFGLEFGSFGSFAQEAGRWLASLMRGQRIR